MRKNRIKLCADNFVFILIINHQNISIWTQIEIKMLILNSDTGGGRVAKIHKCLVIFYRKAAFDVSI